MDSKTKASKQKFGTYTATQDANNDYTSNVNSAQTNSGMQSSMTSNQSQNFGAQQQASKQKFGTYTATQDANNDYTNDVNSTQTNNMQSGMTQTTSGMQSSMTSKQSQNFGAQQQASKAKYGTLTAKADANNDYE